MNYILDNFLKIYASITDEVTKEEKKLPGTMNLIEIMNRHHLENEHSNVIAYLIDPKKNHKHPEYGDLFISMLNKTLKDSNQEIIDYHEGELEIETVSRENPTIENRRLDILIETATTFIIIENKIKAKDQSEQMISYIKDIERRNQQLGKRIFCVYLTPEKRAISEDSLKENEKENYIDGYLNLTYSDILNWISTLKTREDEHVLRAALIQYKDVLEGLIKRRTTIDRKSTITKKLIEYFYNQPEKLELASMLKLLVECRNSKDFNDKRILVEVALPMVIYIKFVLDVKNRLCNSDELQKKHSLEQKLNNSDFKLFCCNTYFESEKEWIENVMSTQKDFGISWQSPNPDVERYFMFANAGPSSAFNGYIFKKSIPQRIFYEPYNEKTDKGRRTEEPVKFVNDTLLKNCYSEKILMAIVENNFIKLIKNMNNKW